MKLTLDCLPCLLRQSLEAARLTAMDNHHEQAIMDAALALLSDYKRYTTSPQLARAIHRQVKQITGSADPYRAIKHEHIRAALELYDQARARVLASDNPLLIAIKAAAAGNLIDAAIYRDIEIGQAILNRLDLPMAICDLDELSCRLREAKTVLIIGDNAGESVFDRLLAEQLKPATVYYAVKSQPIINDDLLDDVIQRAIDAANRATGGRTVYAPNLSGGPARLAAQLRVARDAGVGALLACPMILGVPVFAELLRSEAGVPLIAHPALAGTAIQPALLLGRLFRAFGADATIFPNHGGRFGYSRETCAAIAAAARGPLGGMLPAMPVPAGGMRVDRVDEMLGFFGADTMLLIGGNLLEAGDALETRAAAFAARVREAGNGAGRIRP